MWRLPCPWLLLFFCTPLLGAEAKRTFEFKPGSYLTDITAYHLDKDDLSIDQVLLRRAELFDPTKTSPRPAALSNNQAWLSIELDSKDFPEEVILDSPFPLTDLIELFHYNDEFLQLGQYRDGDRTEFKNRMIPTAIRSSRSSSPKAPIISSSR